LHDYIYICYITLRFHININQKTKKKRKIKKQRKKLISKYNNGT
jgi:hypothetical protein